MARLNKADFVRRVKEVEREDGVDSFRMSLNEMVEHYGGNAILDYCVADYEGGYLCIIKERLETDAEMLERLIADYA